MDLPQHHSSPYDLVFDYAANVDSCSSIARLDIYNAP